MAWTSEQGEKAVTISALVTGGMYAYRYYTEKPSGAESTETKGAVEAYKAAYGWGPVLPLHKWVPAMGITYLVLSILASASPQIGGDGAILVGTGAFFGNALALKKDLNGEKSSKVAKPGNAAAEKEQPELKESLAGQKEENHPPVSSNVSVG